MLKSAMILRDSEVVGRVVTLSVLAVCGAARRLAAAANSAWSAFGVLPLAVLAHLR